MRITTDIGISVAKAQLEKEAQRNGIEFRGALYRITQDADGETKITFTVPRSDLMAMSIVGHWTEQQLLIRVFVNAKQMSFDAMLENDDEYAAE